MRTTNENNNSNNNRKINERNENYTTLTTTAENYKEKKKKARMLTKISPGDKGFARGTVTTYSSASAVFVACNAATNWIVETSDRRLPLGKLSLWGKKKEEDEEEVEKGTWGAEGKKKEKSFLTQHIQTLLSPENEKYQFECPQTRRAWLFWLRRWAPGSCGQSGSSGLRPAHGPVRVCVCVCVCVCVYE